MQITAIEPVGRRGGRVRIRFSDGRSEELAEELAATAGLRADAELAEGTLEALLRSDEGWRAREAALRLLSYRHRTEAELRSRLRRGGFPPPVVDGCLDSLRERGLLDDSRFAEAFARDRVRLSPRGRRRVVQELRGRGVDADTAAAAVEEVLRDEEVGEVDLAREAARRWRRRPEEEPEKARRRLAGYLARRGFAHDAVRTVVEELCPPE